MGTGEFGERASLAIREAVAPREPLRIAGLRIGGMLSVHGGRAVASG